MRRAVLSFGLIAFLVALSACGANVSGKWSLTMKNTSGGEETFDLVIKQAGENLTITANHPYLKNLAGAGTLKNGEITMMLKPDIPLTMTFTGKMDGNKMSGTRKIEMAQAGPGSEAPSAESAESGAESGAPAGAPGGTGATPAVKVSDAWTATKK